MLEERTRLVHLMDLMVYRSLLHKLQHSSSCSKNTWPLRKWFIDSRSFLASEAKPKPIVTTVPVFSRLAIVRVAI